MMSFGCSVLLMLSNASCWDYEKFSSNKCVALGVEIHDA